MPKKKKNKEGMMTVSLISTYENRGVIYINIEL